MPSSKLHTKIIINTKSLLWAVHTLKLPKKFRFALSEKYINNCYCPMKF